MRQRGEAGHEQLVRRRLLAEHRVRPHGIGMLAPADCFSLLISIKHRLRQDLVGTLSDFSNLLGEMPFFGRGPTLFRAPCDWT